MKLFFIFSLMLVMMQSCKFHQYSKLIGVYYYKNQIVNSKIQLHEDSTFNFVWDDGVFFDSTAGIWYLKNNEIIVKSYNPYPIIQKKNGDFEVNILDYYGDSIPHFFYLYKKGILLQKIYGGNLRYYQILSLDSIKIEVPLLFNYTFSEKDYNYQYHIIIKPPFWFDIKEEVWILKTNNAIQRNSKLYLKQKYNK